MPIPAIVELDDGASPPANEVPPLDDIFYYLVRAENQVNVTTWGSAVRDLAINASPGACSVRFP